MANGQSGWECDLKLLVVLDVLVHRASSLAVHASCQSGQICGFENLSRQLTKDSESQSWSRLPVGLVLDVKSLYAAFTATSALPLDWGKPADDIWCLTFQERSKFSVVNAMNSGPPSLESSPGTPNVGRFA